MRPCARQEELPGTSAAGRHFVRRERISCQVEVKLAKRAEPFIANHLHLEASDDLWRFSTNESGGGRHHHWKLEDVVRSRIQRVGTDRGVAVLSMRQSDEQKAGNRHSVGLDEVTLRGPHEQIANFVASVKGCTDNFCQRPDSRGADTVDLQPKRPRVGMTMIGRMYANAGMSLPVRNGRATGRGRSPLQPPHPPKTASAQSPSGSNQADAGGQPRCGIPALEAAKEALAEVNKLAQNSDDAPSTAMSSALMHAKPGLGSGNRPSARHLEQMARINRKKEAARTAGSGREPGPGPGDHSGGGHGEGPHGGHQDGCAFDGTSDFDRHGGKSLQGLRPPNNDDAKSSTQGRTASTSWPLMHTISNPDESPRQRIPGMADRGQSCPSPASVHSNASACPPSPRQSPETPPFDIASDDEHINFQDNSQEPPDVHWKPLSSVRQSLEEADGKLVCSRSASPPAGSQVLPAAGEVRSPQRPARRCRQGRAGLFRQPGYWGVDCAGALNQQLDAAAGLCVWRGPAVHSGLNTLTNPGDMPATTCCTPPPSTKCMTGLANLGNTCYVNATLQCLSAARSLHERLHELCDVRKEIERSFDATSPAKQPVPLPTPSIATAVCPLIAPPDSADSNRSVSTSRAFKDSLGTHFPIFQGFGQHDAHEFLCAAFDALEEEASACQRASPCMSSPDAATGQHSPVGGSIGTGVDDTPMASHSLHKETEVGSGAAARTPTPDTPGPILGDHQSSAPPDQGPCPVEFAFGFRVKTTLECSQCGRTCNSTERFNHLSLNLPEQEEPFRPHSSTISVGDLKQDARNDASPPALARSKDNVLGRAEASPRACGPGIRTFKQGNAWVPSSLLAPSAKRPVRTKRRFSLTYDDDDENIQPRATSQNGANGADNSRECSAMHDGTALRNDTDAAPFNTLSTHMFASGLCGGAAHDTMPSFALDSSQSGAIDARALPDAQSGTRYPRPAAEAEQSPPRPLERLAGCSSPGTPDGAFRRHVMEHNSSPARIARVAGLGGEDVQTQAARMQELEDHQLALAISQSLEEAGGAAGVDRSQARTTITNFRFDFDAEQPMSQQEPATAHLLADDTLEVETEGAPCFQSNRTLAKETLNDASGSPPPCSNTVVDDVLCTPPRPNAHARAIAAHEAACPDSSTARNCDKHMDDICLDGDVPDQHQHRNEGQGPRVSDLVARFFDDEHREWRCDQCACERAWARQKLLSPLPPNLLLHLKRFHSDLQTGITCKLSTRVTLDETIDISQHLSAADANSVTTGGDALDNLESNKMCGVYRLRALVSHHGDQSWSGHYTCCSRLGDGQQWACYDDAHVSVLEQSPNATPATMRGAYLLLYERIEG